jgi:putative two-component system response regulator
MRILVVDDDAMTREMLSRMLAAQGYDVLVAANGREAIEIIRSQSIRLVVSDWEMPEMSGVALCEAVRKADLPGYVYVILLTSHDQSFAVEGMEAGADDFLTKPVEPAELAVRIRAASRVLGLESRDVAIFALAKLAEARDPETGAHLERVQHYTHVLARYLQEQGTFSDELDDEFVKLIRLTSPLHDIGKVAIPDCVLLKPGQLSTEEYEIMKMHTLAGAQALEAALVTRPEARFLKIARDIALSHHEHWDGNGYPRRLAGDDIPLCGRIMTVADVYDALVSKRVYKSAANHHVARNIIIEQRGRQFDPRLVDAFLACEAEFLKIRERFVDEHPNEVFTGIHEAASETASLPRPILV